jgi:hypothetical protein
VSQSNEFRRHNPLCCFSTSVNSCCYCLFHYRLSPGTFGYTLVCKIILYLQNFYTPSRPVTPGTVKLIMPNSYTYGKTAQAVQRWTTGWTIGILGFDSRRGLGIFLSTAASRMALGPTQSPIQWVPRALCLGVKRPGREADHSPPSSAEVKECVLMGWCLAKHRDNFTFTFTFNFNFKFTLNFLRLST